MTVINITSRIIIIGIIILIFSIVILIGYDLIDVIVKQNKINDIIILINLLILILILIFLFKILNLENLPW